jgi:hypothetical protein
MPGPSRNPADIHGGGSFQIGPFRGTVLSATDIRIRVEFLEACPGDTPLHAVLHPVG